MRVCFLEACNCWICEKYSEDIKTLFEKEDLKSLPLPPDITEELCRNWNRGQSTFLYNKINSIK